MALYGNYKVSVAPYMSDIVEKEFRDSEKRGRRMYNGIVDIVFLPIEIRAEIVAYMEKHGIDFRAYVGSMYPDGTIYVIAKTDIYTSNSIVFIAHLDTDDQRMLGDVLYEIEKKYHGE
jgi:hypothetical protein